MIWRAFSEQRMTQLTRKTSRILAACVCLVAVLFAYAPLAGAAWSAYAMACCQDGMCTIPGHHHSKAARQATESNCNHSDGMAKCAMSCCQDSEKFGVTSLAFVLPAPILVLAENRDTRSQQAATPIDIASPIEPASPPPRTNSAAL
jgi:uncharacterized membrane protein